MSDLERFERQVMPHLDAAYNLARWLTRNADDANDVVQDACVRAIRYAGSLRGGDARAWFLTVVRNAFHDWLSRNRPSEMDYDSEAIEGVAADEGADPQRQCERASDMRALAEAVAALPLQYREVLVLREIEELSYKRIAQVVDAPIGTVMSRLSRARELLRRASTTLQTVDARIPAADPLDAIARRE